MTVLRCDALEAVWLPEHGMVGASLRHEGDELLGQRGGLDAYLGKGSAFGVPLLHPWANRLSELPYPAADGSAVKRDANGLAKDGVLAGRRWTVRSSSETAVVAEIVADAPVLAVFPFPHRLVVEVSLDPGAMTVATTLEATGDVAVPVSFGWHPLFTLPGVPREQLRVRLPVAREAVLDDRGLPTGESRAPAFPGGPLGDTVLDAEYPVLADDAATTGFVLSGGGRALSVGFGPPGYPVGHVWAPPGESFVAWEPMTAPTNALVSGDGLRHVAPGETFSATFAVRVAVEP